MTPSGRRPCRNHPLIPTLGDWCPMLLVGLLAGSHAGMPAAARGEPGGVDDPLDPVSCATVRAELSGSLGRAIDLRLSPSMVAPHPGGWRQEEILEFAGELLFDSTGTGQGPLARVWSYYGPGEDLARGDSLRFSVNGRTYSHVRIDLYLASDCCTNRCGLSGCPSAWPDSCREGDWVECLGYGVYRGGNRLQFSGGECPDDIPRTPAELARSPVLAHELAHLAHTVRDTYAERSLSELLATGAEYLVGERWNREPPIPRAHEYDVSLKTGSTHNNRCVGNEVTCKYNIFRLWNAYLYAHFSGAADTQDLVYRWLRRPGSADAGPTWRGLAEVLLEAPFASRLPGDTAGDKLGILYHRYAIARYADAPEFEDGRFGFGPGVSTHTLHLFEWPDSLSLSRGRVIPPVLSLAPGETRTVDAWRDPIQPWAGAESCRVLTTGTDYVVVLADSTRRTNGTLHVLVHGREPLPADQSVHLGYIAYGDQGAAIARGRPLDIRDEGPSGDEGASSAESEATLRIDGFGDRLGAVVLVLSMVETEPSERFAGVKSWEYSLEVRFDPESDVR